MDTNGLGADVAATRLTQSPALPNVASRAMDIHRMRQTAQEFESVFLAEMLRPMFQNIEAEAPFGGGAGQQIYRDMQVDEYGKAIAESGGIGLADAVLREMIKMQEGE